MRSTGVLPFIHTRSTSGTAILDDAARLYYDESICRVFVQYDLSCISLDLWLYIFYYCRSYNSRLIGFQLRSVRWGSYEYTVIVWIFYRFYVHQTVNRQLSTLCRYENTGAPHPRIQNIAKRSRSDAKIELLKDTTRGVHLQSICSPNLHRHCFTVKTQSWRFSHRVRRHSERE